MRQRCNLRAKNFEIFKKNFCAEFEFWQRRNLRAKKFENGVAVKTAEFFHRMARGTWFICIFGLIIPRIVRIAGGYPETPHPPPGGWVLIS